MKRAVAVALFLLLFRTLPLFAQFEGSIDMKMTRRVEGAPRSVFYTMSVSGEKLAAQAAGGGGGEQQGRFIFRGDRKVMWVIDDNGKTYLEISLTDDSDGRKREGAGRHPAVRKVNLRKTGGSERILGYSCDEWVAEDTGKVTHIWGTPKLGNIYDGLMKSFEKMNPRMVESQMSGWEGELARMKVFPLKIVTTENADTSESQEVTKIDPKTLEASVFEPPGGYKKQTLGAGMGKMMEQLQELQSRRAGAGDSSLNKEDLEKMMKEMQKQYEQGQKDQDDSSKEHE